MDSRLRDAFQGLADKLIAEDSEQLVTKHSAYFVCGIRILSILDTYPLPPQRSMTPEESANLAAYHKTVTDQLHQDFPTELKREIAAITCEGCRRNEPIIIHDGTPTSMAALKGKAFHTSGRCTSKAHEFLPLFDSIAAKAFEMAANAVTKSRKDTEELFTWMEQTFGERSDFQRRKTAHVCDVLQAIAGEIRALSPASARRQLQLDLLRAQLEEAKWWKASDARFGRRCLSGAEEDHIARLESEIAALEGGSPNG